MIGRKISHYQVLERLGSGGMGEIYKAQDSRLNRMVAIKVLSRRSAGDEERKRRFIQEAQAASSLNHPNIITIYDIVSEEENDYMVMEFVPGQTLAQIIPSGGLGVGKTMEYAVQIADALAAAHAAGIVHRDLKPSNVMITETGRVKILDFGLAKVTAVSQLDSDETLTMGEKSLTVEGSIVGTVSYMSPEQAEGKRVDARSDIFSFGVVVYEMITGTKAFWGDSAVSTLTSILRDEVKPISQYAAGVPFELEEVVMRALRKEPMQRWQSMQEVHTRLSGLRQRYESGVLSQAVRPRSRKWVGPLVLAAMASVGGGAWLATRRPAAPIVTPQPAVMATPPPPPAAPVEKAPEKKETAKVPAPRPEYVLTNKGVIEMAEAKVSPSLMISEIRAAKLTKFDLSVPEVIKLAKAGVPDEVVEVMRDPKAPPKAQPPGFPPGMTPPDATGKRNFRGFTDMGRGTGRGAMTLFGGFPVPLVLTEEVPAEPVAGAPLHFQVEQDVRIGPMLMIEKGAAVTGEVVAGRAGTSGRGPRIMFKLSTVDAVDGSKVKLRAAPGRTAERPEFPLNLGGRGRGEAIPAGSKVLAYVDGDQPIGPPKR